MTLDEAIEIVTRWHAGGYATRIDDMNPAISLLIEAGKVIKDTPGLRAFCKFSLLPGETKE